jgi:hypothetical protein
VKAHSTSSASDLPIRANSWSTTHVVSDGAHSSSGRPRRRAGAAIYWLIGKAKLNGLNPEAYPGDGLERIAAHAINQIEELLPWSLAPAVAAQQRSPRRARTATEAAFKVIANPRSIL